MEKGNKYNGQLSKEANKQIMPETNKEKAKGRT